MSFGSTPDRTATAETTPEGIRSEAVGPRKVEETLRIDASAAEPVSLREPEHAPINEDDDWRAP
jgi:hypothetical protein